DVRPVGVAGAQAAADRVGVGSTESPYPAPEAVRALDAGIRPLERLLRRAGEHDEEARGIGAHRVDERLGIHAIVLRLRHGADAAVLDRRTVGLEAGTNDRTLGVVHVLDVFGPE